MRFIKIILAVLLSLIALISVLGLAAGASKGQDDSFYYVFFGVLGIGSFLGAYFLVRNIRKHKGNTASQVAPVSQPVIASQQEARCTSPGSVAESPRESPIGKESYATRPEVVAKIADIISCECDDSISLEMVLQNTNMPPAVVGEYVSGMLFDVLSEATARQPVLSEKQEKKIRELVAACGATLSKDVENQLEKLATIRDIVSFKADPREFVKKSLLVE